MPGAFSTGLELFPGVDHCEPAPQSKRRADQTINLPPFVWREIFPVHLGSRNHSCLLFSLLLNGAYITLVLIPQAALDGLQNVFPLEVSHHPADTLGRDPQYVGHFLDR